MTEDYTMALRPNRKPKYHPQDQDPENASYSRPNYVKMTTLAHNQQYISPSVLLNQNAKLLVKFINKANKQYKEYRLKKQIELKQTQKKEIVTNEKVIVQAVQTTKKTSTTTKNAKTQPPKKNKQLYNFKGLHQNNDLSKNINSQQMIKNIKGMQNILNNKGIYSGAVSNQLSQLKSLYPNLKDINYQSLTQPFNPDLFKFNAQNQAPKHTKQHQQLIQNPKPSIDKKHYSQQDQKLFKRSAYHIAIAYHIYLKKLRDRGITQGVQIDPTYPAKLMKQKAVMENGNNY